MARLFWVVGLSMLLVALSPVIASAHVLKIDGAIGAVLHIPPDDNPQAGQQTRYNLSFVDDKGLIDLNRCICGLTVLSGEQKVLTSSLIVGSRTIGDALVTIDQPGAYTFQFTGTPTGGAKFQAFELDYPVRISGGQADMQQIPELLWIGIAMSVGLVLLAASRVNYQEE